MTPERQQVEIEYCTQCRWLLRSAGMAQELLTTFQDEVGELALISGTSGGVFDIRANGQLLWSRKIACRFPDINELKISRKNSHLQARMLAPLRQPRALQPPGSARTSCIKCAI